MATKGNNATITRPSCSTAAKFIILAHLWVSLIFMAHVFLMTNIHEGYDSLQQPFSFMPQLGSASFQTNESLSRQQGRKHLSNEHGLLSVLSDLRQQNMDVTATGESNRTWLHPPVDCDQFLHELRINTKAKSPDVSMNKRKTSQLDDDASVFARFVTELNTKVPFWIAIQSSGKSFPALIAEEDQKLFDDGVPSAIDSLTVAELFPSILPNLRNLNRKEYARAAKREEKYFVENGHRTQTGRLVVVAVIDGQDRGQEVFMYNKQGVYSQSRRQGLSELWMAYASGALGHEVHVLVQNRDLSMDMTISEPCKTVQSICVASQLNRWKNTSFPSSLSVYNNVLRLGGTNSTEEHDENKKITLDDVARDHEWIQMTKTTTTTTGLSLESLGRVSETNSGAQGNILLQLNSPSPEQLIHGSHALLASGQVQIILLDVSTILLKNSTTIFQSSMNPRTPVDNRNKFGMRRLSSQYLAPETLTSTLRRVITLLLKPRSMTGNNNDKNNQNINVLSKNTIKFVPFRLLISDVDSATEQSSIDIVEILKQDIAFNKTKTKQDIQNMSMQTTANILLKTIQDHCMNGISDKRLATNDKKLPSCRVLWKQQKDQIISKK